MEVQDENVAALGELCGSGAGGAARTWVWSQRIGSGCRAAPAPEPWEPGAAGEPEPCLVCLTGLMVAYEL